ncbi:MAG TPA: 3'(2'),5'-bisphosphate nucleotidase CysQ [Candidatus Binatia bacterium]|nr:3'(2'),5'-bisphosphate nucleotidase CysQ [Candidatus Binatia bacterium]
MVSQYNEELNTAERAAREAGLTISKLFKGKFDVHEKSKNNPVTTADLEANRQIREIIQRRFPEDGWLSEEDSDDARRLASSRVWIIDPIDGTKEFIEGVPQFAVSIGFVVRGRPKVSVIYNPVEERLYRAVAGRGTDLNGERIHVTSRREIHGALLLVSRSEPLRKFQVFVDLCEIQSVGSIAYRLAKVAGGEGDGTLTFRSIHEWDVCAGALMVEEAGGKVVDGNGKTLLFNRRETKHHGIVASNEKLTDEIQGLVATVLAAK